MNTIEDVSEPQLAVGVLDSERFRYFIPRGGSLEIGAI